MVDENPYPEEPDSGNKADKEPEEDECLWKINSLDEPPTEDKVTQVNLEDEANP